MSKLIEYKEKKYTRQHTDLMCEGCIALKVSNGVDCKDINKAAKQQHEMADCVSTHNIYVEVKDVPAT